MRKVKVRVYRRNPSRTKSRHRRGRARMHKRSRSHARRRNPGTLFNSSRRKSRSRGRSRVKRSRTFARRRNPVRSHKRRSSVRRRNPMSSIKNLLSGGTLMRVAAMGTGYIAGRQVIALVTTGGVFGMTFFTPPAMLSTTLRPGVGLVNVLLGMFLSKRAKGAFVKDAAIGLITSGGVDIITSVVNMVKPGTLGMYVDDSQSEFRGPGAGALGMSASARDLGRVGPRYGIPRRLSVGGYENSSFSAVDSSFPAG